MAQFAVGAKARASQIGLVGTESIRTANSSTFTTEAVVDTLSVPVVSGRRYKIVWDGAFYSDNGTGYARGRIRETNISGTVLMLRQVATTVTNQSFGCRMEVRWTATSTTTVTFVATGTRQSGTGNVGAQAGTDSPTTFYVENVSVI